MKVMSAIQTVIRLNNGDGWQVINEKNISKLFLQCEGVKAQIDVKETKDSQFDTKYNANLKQLEIESKDQDNNNIKLVRLNDGSKWGFIYDKKASKIFLQCEGVKAQIDVKETKDSQFKTIHNDTVKQMEIEYQVDGDKPTVDVFNINKIYADSKRSTKALDWYMGKDNFRERIAENKWLEGNQGQFITDSQNNVLYRRNPNTNQQVRMNVYATADPGEQRLGRNRYEIIKTKDSESDSSSKGGYLFRPQDWRDVEITCYIYVNDNDADDNYAWFVRGGYQGNNAYQDCSSCKYSASLYYSTGRFRPSKKTSHGEDHHANDSDFEVFGGPLGETRGKWIGYKAIVYNLSPVGVYPNSDTPIFPVKIELWTDTVENQSDEGGNFTPHNKWVKKMEIIDNPNDHRWGPDQNTCGAPRWVTLSWGGPIITFRIDKNGDNDPLNNFRLKFASIREIEPGVRAGAQ